MRMLVDSNASKIGMMWLPDNVKTWVTPRPSSIRTTISAPLCMRSRVFPDASRRFSKSDMGTKPGKQVVCLMQERAASSDSEQPDQGETDHDEHEQRHHDREGDAAADA